MMVKVFMTHTLHILVIDDDNALRSAIAKHLSGAGYTVMEASNGREGLDLALKHHPALIFLDYQMPDMDGLAVLKELRQDEWGKKAEVIFDTNGYDTAIVYEALASGVHDYVLKADTSLDQILELARKYVSL